MFRSSSLGSRWDGRDGVQVGQEEAVVVVIQPGGGGDGTSCDPSLTQETEIHANELYNSDSLLDCPLGVFTSPSIMAKKTRGLYYVDRSFANRKLGLLKKSYEISQLTQAHVALLIECDGITHLFQSDDWFAPYISNIPTAYKVDPDHVAEIIRKDKAAIKRRADRKKRRRNEDRARHEESDRDVERTAEGQKLNEGGLEMNGETKEAAAASLCMSTKPPTVGGAEEPYPLAVDFFQRGAVY